jgi:hypothetical protein
MENQEVVTGKMGGGYRASRLGESVADLLAGVPNLTALSALEIARQLVLDRPVTDEPQPS